MDIANATGLALNDFARIMLVTLHKTVCVGTTVGTIVLAVDF